MCCSEYKNKIWWTELTMRRKDQITRWMSATNLREELFERLPVFGIVLKIA